MTAAVCGNSYWKSGDMTAARLDEYQCDNEGTLSEA